MAAPRVLVYSGDGYGLGHLHICVTLLHAVARRRPDALLLLVTGAPQPNVFPLPTCAEYVRLPAVANASWFADLPLQESHDAQSSLRGLARLRQALLTETLLTFQPDVMHVDWAPAGHDGELRQGLLRLRAACPATCIVAGLPDMTDPTTLRSEWSTHDVDTLLECVYDRLVIYGDPRVYDPSDDYALSASARARTTFSGYVRRAVTLRPRAEVRAEMGVDAQPLVVVTVGGGADGAQLLETWLAALHEPALVDVASLVISGPLLDAAARARLDVLAQALPNVQLVTFTEHLSDLMHAADVVVAMGGYNTAVEVAALPLRHQALLVPRSGLGAEQLLRAERFAAHDLVRILHPADLTAPRLAQSVRAALDGSPAHGALDLAGAERLADVLVSALPDAESQPR